jgi:cytosine/adenosine deaminase-related metal-dependent hydrolase
MARTLTARWIVPIDRPPLPNGTVTVQDGTITAVEVCGKRAADEDLENCAILPGLVNAHTHLDLSGLRGQVPPGSDFMAWLRAVIKFRRSRSPEDVQRDVQVGIAECIKHGTTLVGDISAGGASWQELSKSSLRAVVFYELLGLPTGRAANAWPSASTWLKDHPATSTCRAGLSPHAPYSVCESLFDLALAEGHRRDLPVAIHIAETRAELELLQDHRGPLVDFLQELGVWHPQGLIASTTELIAKCRRAGRTLLIHGNYLSPEQASSQDTLIYCPRTHAGFGHDPYPLEDFLARGTRIGLGTDSLASNPDLSVLEEARLLHRHFPRIPPADVLRMATMNGAEALGWGGVTGSLTPGKRAAMIAVPLPSEPGDPCEQILAGTGSVELLR